MSRRVLFTLWPFTGHLLPQISIAHALRERGHEVAFYSGDGGARDRSRSSGFPFFGFDRLDEERGVRGDALGRLRRPPRPSRPRAADPDLLRDWLVETIPDQVADLDAVIADWQPGRDRHRSLVVGPVAVLPDLDRTPVALSSTFMGPLIPGPHAPAFGFGLRPPRGTVGRAVAARAHRRRPKPPAGRCAAASTRSAPTTDCRRWANRSTAYTGAMPLYLVGNVRELDYGRHDLPRSVHYVGNCIWYPERDVRRRPLDGRRVPTERPWVHVAESTLASGDPFLLRTAVAGAGRRPRRGHPHRRVRA